MRAAYLVYAGFFVCHTLMPMDQTKPINLTDVIDSIRWFRREEVGTHIKQCTRTSYGELLKYAIEKKCTLFIEALFAHCCILENLPEQLRVFLTTPGLVFNDATTHLLLTALMDHIDTIEIDSCLQLLKQHTVSLECLNQTRSTPLMWSVEWRKYAMTQSLLKAGCDPNIKNPITGETALHLARNHPIIDLLIRKGNANVHARDYKGETPLHKRTVPYYQCEPQEIKVLIAHGAQVNAQDYFGNTPLHMTRNEWTILTLLRLGADPFIKNSAGKPAIFIELSKIYARQEIKNMEDIA